MKIEFNGYNDTKTLAFYDLIKLLQILIVTSLVSMIAVPFAIIFSIYELLYIFILPGGFFIIMPVAYLINSKSTTFLKGVKTKHKFVLDSGYLYKDSRLIKSYSEIKIYKFKKFIFLVLPKTYYIVHNNDYIQGSRDEFLKQCKFSLHKKHHVTFDLPYKSEEEIIDFIFGNTINELKGERTFYSKDMKRIISIDKNNIGSYSTSMYRIDIFNEEERMHSHIYGQYIPEYIPGRSKVASFFGTLDEAYNDIKNELIDYIELK